MSSDKLFVEPDEVESLVFDWGVLKWMCSPRETDSERMSCGVVTLKPGKGHERHNHPNSDEMLYVVRGEGEQEIDDETRTITGGEMLFIPEGVYHGTMNTGGEPLILIAVYTPPGPEEKLRDQPDCRIVPPGELPASEHPERSDVP